MDTQDAGDKGYDSNAIRRRIEADGMMPNIPPKANRRWKSCFSPVLYRQRNAIERMFCRLKDFRRIATRYDRLAVNSLAAVCIAAVVSYFTSPDPSTKLVQADPSTPSSRGAEGEPGTMNAAVQEMAEMCRLFG